MAVESRWWSGITRYANGRSAGSRDPLAIRSPRLSRHKKKGSSALIPSSLGYQLCGYRHCLSQERNTAGAVGTQPVGFRKSEASSAVGMSKEESKDFVVGFAPNALITAARGGGPFISIFSTSAILPQNISSELTVITGAIMFD